MKCFTATHSARTLVLVLLATASAEAQPGFSDPITVYPARAPVLVGPVIGVNRNFHSGGFRTVTGDLSCPVFEAGTGWGFLGGMTAEILLTSVSAIIPRVTYESRPATFTSSLPDALVQMSGHEGTVVQKIAASSEITYGIVNIEALFKHEVGMLGPLRLALAAGPAFAWVLNGRSRQVQDLIEPPNARFKDQDEYRLENGGRRLVFFDDEIVARRTTRFSLKGGVQAELGLFGNQWYMTPGIYYDVGLSDVTRAENWQLSSVVFMVDLRRGF